MSPEREEPPVLDITQLCCPATRPSKHRPRTVVQRGAVSSKASGPAGRLLAYSLGLPGRGRRSAGLRVEPLDPTDPRSAVRWTRTFGDTSWATTLIPTDDAEVLERIGPFTLRFGVVLAPGRSEMHLEAVQAGPFEMPCRWLPINITGVVEARAHQHVTSVETSFGWLGRLRYLATMADPS